jgi:hypothetical protein
VSFSTSHLVLNGGTAIFSFAGLVALAVAAVLAAAFWITFVYNLGGAVVATVIVAFAVAFGGSDSENFAGPAEAVIALVALPFAVSGSVGLVSRWTAATSREGVFLSLFFPFLTMTALACPWLTSRSALWGGLGILLLIFGLLTLVNVPFDWFAIGLTRALLRRGLAPGGTGPFFYAIVDAIVAPPVIALLAFVTVFAVQTFDDIAALRAGPSARILPLVPGIARARDR